MLRHAIAFFVGTIAIFGQDAPKEKVLAFEVADIKLNTSNAEPNGNFLPGGRVQITNVPLRMLIVEAFKIRNNELIGGEAWLDSERFDVVAKAVPTSTEDELRKMLQKLLADRFKMVVHREEKQMPAYALTVGKNGPKMKESDKPVPQGQPLCRGGEGEPGMTHRVCQHITMAEFAQTLPRIAPAYFQTPVVDQTGLKGAYDFQLDWTPLGRIMGSNGDGARSSGSGGASEPTGGRTIFEAVASQLGLKLESKKLPVSVLVLDSIEKMPTEN